MKALVLKTNNTIQVEEDTEEFVSYATLSRAVGGMIEAVTLPSGLTLWVNEEGAARAFDMQGAVIGVNTAIYSPNGGSVGIGFAIPSAIARPVVEELRARGRVERGWIGVAVQPLTPEIALGLGLQATQDGALVAQVEPGSPAAIGGLRQGDVVVGVDGKPVNRLRELPRAIAATKPGASATLDILRRGAAMQVTLRVGATPQAERAAADEPAGLAFAPLTAELRWRDGLVPVLVGWVWARCLLAAGWFLSDRLYGVMENPRATIVAGLNG